MILDSKLKEIIYKVIYEQHSLENTYIDVSDLEKLYKIFKQSRCEFYLLKHLENIPLNKNLKFFRSKEKSKLKYISILKCPFNLIKVI